MNMYEHDLDIPRGYTGLEIIVIILGSLVVSAGLLALLGG